MAKTGPCFMNSYKLQQSLYFGDFGWSADALVVLLLFIHILYDENSATIIQFKVLKPVDQMYM